MDDPISMIVGYECSHGAYGSFDSVATINDLLDQYKIPDPKWKDPYTSGKTYTYGDGAKSMIPHPEYAGRPTQAFL